MATTPSAKPLRIVYSGPGLAGKTMSLKGLKRALGGELVSVASETERTVSFTAELPSVGVPIPVMLVTIPGAVFYNQSRIASLRGVDVVVLVADGQPEQLRNNRDAGDRLRANLAVVGRPDVPVVLQANKQDLPGVMDAESLLPWLRNVAPIAAIDSNAMNGSGLLEALRAAVTPFAPDVRWDVLRERMRAAHPRLDEDRFEVVDLETRAGSLGDAFRDLRNRTLPARVRLRGLDVLPPEIGQLGPIEYLDLEDNGLAELSPAIGRLASLHTLALRRNVLDALPPEIGQLSRLSRLFLDGNHLETLPEEIAGAGALSLLSLDHNPRLEALPSSLGRMRSLKTLLLRGVPLTRLPESLREAQALEVLFLRDTRFREPPPELGALARLRELEIRGNDPPLDLAKLFGVLSTARALWYLDLSRGGVTALPPEIAHLTSLATLDVSKNPLRALPDALRQNHRLTEITLDLEALDPAERESIDSRLPRWPASPNAGWIADRNADGSTTFRRGH